MSQPQDSNPVHYSTKLFFISVDGEEFLYQDEDHPTAHLVFLSADDALRFVDLNKIQADKVEVYEVKPGKLEAAYLGTWQTNTGLDIAFVTNITNIANLN